MARKKKAKPFKTPEPFKDGSCLMNNPAGSITNLAAENFIECIQHERQLGYGFVPFAGAGFSAPSGAPLVHEIKPYLERCICMALGAEDPCMEPWDPRTDQWPPFLDRSRINRDPSHWKRLIKEHLQKQPPGDNLYAPILQEGLGQTAEWRTALLFLSRIDRDRNATGSSRNQPARLEAPRQEIIDSCFREVLKEKHPALGHKMLAMLAGALRLDLVLTTNFDDLLERAFAAARNPLEVFEVQLNGPLPHWSAVSDVRSLIKLHGNRHSIRADYSLDARPSETDRERFLGYLLSDKGRSSLANGVKSDLDFQNHLMVMGVSVDDRRVRSFIEHAWTYLESTFRVFWLCYSPRDVDAVIQFTKDFRKEPGRQTFQGSIILRHTDFGLFLLQLYQTIRKNLPPLSTFFPSVSRLTIPPMESSSPPRKRGAAVPEEDFCRDVRRHLKAFEEPKFPRHKLIVAHSKDKVPGVTSCCGVIFREMEADNICLWLDMNDIASTDSLFEVLLEAAYCRLGMENWTPVYLADDQQTAGRLASASGRPRANEIRRLVDSLNKKWIVFLNARETPGANFGATVSAKANGWLDNKESPRDSADHSACVGRFLMLIKELCGADSKRISVVLLVRNAEPKPALIEKLEIEGLLEFSVDLEHSSREFQEDRIVAGAIAWTNKEKQKQRFLHALVLMQRPRLLASVWSPAVSPQDSQAEPNEDRLKWVDGLEQLGLVRRKMGGFIWIHSRCRQKIRAILRNPRAHMKDLAGSQDAKEALKGWNTKAAEAKIHIELARWYEKLLDCSEAPPAVFEAVHHLCHAAEAYLAAPRSKREAVSLACRQIDAASALLKVNSFLIQTRGYSLGSCRHLEYIRGDRCRAIRHKSAAKDVKDAVSRLRIMCTEVMRAIEREVGEDAKAYLRQQEYGRLSAGLELQTSNAKRSAVPQELSKRLSGCLRQGAWLRWWRWNGMLGIASRSFRVAKRALNKALECAVEGDPKYPSGNYNFLTERDAKSLLLFQQRQTKADAQEVRIEVLRTVEQFVELLLLEDSVLHRLVEFGKPDSSPLPRVKKIEECISTGQKLVAAIREQDHSSDSHNTIWANWCDARLLMHRSVCASRHVQLEFESKVKAFQNAMGLLGDAEASLHLSDPRRHRPELAMVELHRADARLREAESIVIYGDGKEAVPFVKLCQELEVTEPESDWEEQAKNLRAKYLGKSEELQAPIDAKLRRAKSLVIDGLRFLNRAEPVLRDRRRNVWWITWFFERRLRAIALCVWASVFEKDTPIPFLGLEATMRKTSTAADILLEDATRMIRVDAYRFATIVKAYASCTKALQIRLMLDSNSLRLPERQTTMYEKLKKSIQELEAVTKRREEPEWVISDERNKLDPAVLQYIQGVQERANMIAEHVKAPYPTASARNRELLPFAAPPS